MLSNDFPVPNSPEQITAEWLSSALNKVFPSVTIHSTTIERIGEEYGLASQIFRCKMQCHNCPKSVVVKLWSTAGVAGFREVLFYDKFATRIDLWVPTCFYADVKQESQRGVLVLENLDMTMQGDCLQQLTVDRALKLTDLLGNIHGAWWNCTELRSTNWLPVSRVVHETDWYEARRNLFLQRFSDRLDKVTRRLLENIDIVVTRSNQRLSGGPVTLLHSDLHLDNVVFVGKAERPVLLDWARVSKGSPALDVAELVFSIGQSIDRDRLLDRYLEVLRSRGVEDYNEGVFRYNLGGALLRKFINSTIGVARWQPASRREADMIDVTIKRACEAVRDWQEYDADLFLV